METQESTAMAPAAAFPSFRAQPQTPPSTPPPITPLIHAIIDAAAALSMHHSQSNADSDWPSTRIKQDQPPVISDDLADWKGNCQQKEEEHEHEQGKAPSEHKELREEKWLNDWSEGREPAQQNKA